MPSSNSNKAQYDADGNIIISGAAETAHLEDSVWELVPDDEEIIADIEKESPKIETQKKISQGVRYFLERNMDDALQEGINQYSASAKEAKKNLRHVWKALQSSPLKLKSFLLQPVWIANGNKDSTEYSRLSLFVIDTVRFGFTFAAIFAGLFVAMNYQSFFELASKQLNPVEHALKAQALSHTVENTFENPLGQHVSQSGLQDGDLLTILPAVGPPEDRIIIPKLGLNVPLKAPPLAPLLNEEWDKLEVAIQETLEDGVAHYPGTAKPGQAGNFFVTGHSSYYPWAEGAYKTVFARLHELNVGDEYWVYHGGDKHRYIVRGKKEVQPTDVSVLDQPTNKRIGTLMTCTPIGTTLRRLIISSEEVDPQTGIALDVGEKGSTERRVVQTKVLPI